MGEAKENEQADLAKTVIANVLKSIQDEKAQRDILAGAVAEVERESTACVSSCGSGVLIGGLDYTELVKSKAI